MFSITDVSKSVGKDDVSRYTIQNDFLNLGKKLILLDGGKPVYELKHKLGHLYQK